MIKKEINKMKSLIKKLSTAVLIAGLFAIASRENAHAVNPDTMNITVTVATALSVDITGDPYDFGTQNAGITTVSTRVITITNDTGGRTEDYQINGSNTANWTLAATSGAETFALFAMLNSIQPASGDFGGTDDDLTTSGQNMSSTLFSGDEDGDDVVDTATRNLWFRLDTPTSSASQAEQTIVVTVTAADASTL